MTKIRGDKPVSVSKDGDDTLIQTEGNLRIDVERVRKITIDNIVRVRRYLLSNEGDFIIHKIEFVNDGTATIGYSKESGKLMQFRATGIVIAVEGDRVTLDVTD